VSLNVGSRQSYLLLVCRTLEGAGETPSEAVAAVQRADIGGQKGDPALIPVYEAFGDTMVDFRKWIDMFFGQHLLFAFGWNNLTADGVKRVVLVDKVEKIEGNFQRQDVCIISIKHLLILGEHQVASQLLLGCDDGWIFSFLHEVGVP